MKTKHAKIQGFEGLKNSIHLHHPVQVQAELPHMSHIYDYWICREQYDIR